MQKPANVNLYELPACSICLEELSQGLVSLTCGHLFHFHCLEQCYEYSNLCPNCKKRTFKHEWHILSFNAVASIDSGAMIRRLFEELSDDQKRQAIILYERYETLSGKYLQAVQAAKDQAEQLEAMRRQTAAQAAAVGKLEDDCRHYEQSARRLHADYQEKCIRQKTAKAELKSISEQYSALLARNHQIERYEMAVNMLDNRQSDLVAHLATLPDEDARQEHLLDLCSLNQSRYRQAKELCNELKAQLHSEKSRADGMTAIVKNLRSENDRIMQRLKRERKRRDDESSLSSRDRQTPKLDLPLPVAKTSKPGEPKGKLHFSIREMLEKRKV